MITYIDMHSHLNNQLKKINQAANIDIFETNCTQTERCESENLQVTRLFKDGLE